MAPPSIKIVYYDAKGRAEITRLVLAAGGIKWEEEVIDDAKWKTEKEKTPFGQLPVMEVNGKRFAQSLAMANFAAREAGLYGKNNLEALQIDQVIQLGNDLLNVAVQAFHEKDEAKKAEQLKHFTEVDAPKYFALYEKLLKDNGTGYFVGNSLSLADIFIYDQIFTPSIYKSYKADGFPLLLALKQKVESQDKIKAYLANRKETQF
jgi:glutathione S-transferase